MKRTLLFLLVFCLGILHCFAQTPEQQVVVQTVLVLPFENQSNAPGLEWIGESFPEILGQRLSAAKLFVISREDRNLAFDHFGIPVDVRPSRATLYRIAEQMDADYVVFGQYNFDGQKFTTTANVLNMKQLRMSPDIRSEGPLTSLIEVQTGLAWDILKQITPDAPGTREEFVRTADPVRLDAFENYVRGLVATTRQDRVRYFRQAIRINPEYYRAMLALARTYFDNREYELAASWFSRIPKSEASAGQANFYLGLAEFYEGNFDKAEEAFRLVETRLPLTEVYNNLGVVASRRGRKAIDYFQKAVQQDPNDADYRFNLAVQLYRSGDSAGAARQLREALNRRPNDSEAKDLLNQINSGSPAITQSSTSAADKRIPMERIKRNYDENLYRQLALEVQNAMERSLANADSRTRSSYYTERGMDLLDKGFAMDAEREFRQAIVHDPTNYKAHTGMARVAEKNNDAVTARREAEASLRLQQNADAFLVLGRLELKENHLDAAQQNADKALWLEPNNAGALALKREIASKRGGQQ